MKNMFCNLIRLSGISAFLSILALLIGMFLQMKKANISDEITSQQFDTIMRMYYLGTEIKSVADWTLLISFVVGVIAGILYISRR